MDDLGGVAFPPAVAAISTRTVVRRLRLVLIPAAIGLSFAVGTTSVAIDSIKFDLGRIGESIYEAHVRSGRWPGRIEDLEGTTYLRMPYRRGMLERGAFVVVWQDDLAASPAANPDRVLAYEDGSLFARLGLVWGCWGDLRIALVDAERRAALAKKGGTR
jgi:hypothetical protein